MTEASVAVMADAQFGAAKILRPFTGFESIYNGVSALTPIMWSPGGQALDDAAGKLGYSHNLLKGLSVPMGARVTLWIPVFGTASSPANPYTWQIFWRFRNLYDFRTQRIPYHFPKQSPGTTDTTPVTGGPRVLIPACSQSIAYAQAEVLTGVAPATQPQNLHAETIVNQAARVIGGAGLETPLTPTSGKGMIQQGVFNETGPNPGNPSWTEIDVQALGDELLIGQYRNADLAAHPNWEMVAFGSYDGVFPFARLNISPDYGLYVLVGSAP